MGSGYVKLALAALIPALATRFLNRLSRAGRFDKLSYARQQVLFGLIFGALAVLGTEWGITLESSVVNCRDAAPLCAGLFFGGPAGIIAGTIGALERWFAVYWGAGSYTRLACTLATFIAGLLAAALRKFVFESKQPHLLLAAACAFLVELLHQNMVFFLHFDDTVNAAAVVRVTAMPMLIANTLSVLLAGFLCACSDKSLFSIKKGHHTLAVLIERSLLVVVTAAFLITVGYTYRQLTSVAEHDAETDSRAALTYLAKAPELQDGTVSETMLRDGSYTALLSEGRLLLIADESGKVLACSAETLPTETLPLPVREDKAFTCRLSDTEYLAYMARVNGYMLISAAPKESVYLTRDVYLLSGSFVQLVFYGLLFAFITFMLRRSVVNSIRSINATLAKITSGDLEQRVNVKGSLEFEELSADINTTVDTLKAYIAETQAQSRRELTVARNIQSNALPCTFPAFPKRKDLDIYAMTLPARQVGGDFYDLYFAGENKLYILAADVSGKGIPAAMFMMRAKTQLKSVIESGGTLEEAFFRGNNALSDGNDAEMFVTVWMAEIDMGTGMASFINAGHNPPVLSGADGSCGYLKTKPSFVLAGMENIRYKKQTRPLYHGDRIVLYTDGVTEAVNPDNEMFGEERLLSLVKENRAMDAARLVEKIRAEVLAFAGEAEQSDDITLLVFDYKGPGAAAEISFPEAKIQDLEQATAFMEAELRKRGCGEKALRQMDVVLDEVFANIVNYAYPGTSGPIALRIEETAQPERALRLIFTDEGLPFNPLMKEDPDTSLAIEERQPGGLGIFIVKQFTDAMEYEYTDNKNVLRLTKRL